MMRRTSILFAPAAPASRPADRPTDGIFYTNRCGTGKYPGCNRAVTKLDILEAMGVSPKRHSVCPCGCNSWRSSNFKWWEELFLFRSWRLWWAIKQGRLAPPPTTKDVSANRDSMIKQVAALDDDPEDGPDGYGADR